MPAMKLTKSHKKGTHRKHRPITMPAKKLAKSHKKGTHLKHRPITMPAMKLAKTLYKVKDTGTDQAHCQQ